MCGLADPPFSKTSVDTDGTGPVHTFIHGAGPNSTTHCDNPPFNAAAPVSVT